MVFLPFPRVNQNHPRVCTLRQVVKRIKNRKELNQGMLEDIVAILMDSTESSMGMDISPVDLLNIDMFASRVIWLTD